MPYFPFVLYQLLKSYARFAIKIYCRKIIINKPEILQLNGPILLACNHPNSFLDGMILTTLFEHNVYSLARGDAFSKHETLLRKLHLLPVYRTSEGVENLEHNYTTFAACHQIFEQKGIVIIFSEGGCVNEWHLRPLRKGTARLATSAWQKGIDLTVIPVGLNYNTFRNYGKNVNIHFGEPLDKEAIMQHQTDGKLFLSFNEQLQSSLQNLVYEIEPSDRKKLREKVYVPQPTWKKILLSPFALAGTILFAPFYFPIKWITVYFFNNDHFDSVVTALTILAFPFYILILFLILKSLLSAYIALMSLTVIIFCAWATIQLKNQLD